MNYLRFYNHSCLPSIWKRHQINLHGFSTLLILANFLMWYTCKYNNIPTSTPKHLAQLIITLARILLCSNVIYMTNSKRLSKNEIKKHFRLSILTETQVVIKANQK